MTRWQSRLRAVLSHGLRSGAAWRACIAAIAIGCAWPAAIAFAQTPAKTASGEASETRVKAAFLYRFPHYVEWPASAWAKADSPYVIAVVNDDEIAEELQKISAGRPIGNRPVTVQKLQPGESLSNAHVLFIGDSERARQAQWLKQAAGQAILVVTETDGALAQGSIINFRIAEERVRFEISLDAADKAGLKLSSRLLSIAISVTKDAKK